MALHAQPGWLAAAGLAALLLSPHARAGQGRDNCVGYIDSLPTTVDTPGTWCLRANLGTTVTAGGGIQGNGNNIVIDCNGYRIENTAAGNRAMGIAINGNNHIVRNCDVRGFFAGIVMSGTNVTVEDNRLRDIGATGIQSEPDTAVRGNHILRVGGDATFEGTVTGIAGAGEITDNVIESLIANPAVNIHGGVTAIYVYHSHGVIRRNRIRTLMPAGNGAAQGIHSDISTTYITDNQIVGPGLNKAGQYSIRCTGGESFAYDNIASGFSYTWTSGNTSGWTGSIICNLAGGDNVDKT